MNLLTSMSTESTKKCQWQQRLALIRHNLHTASLTQDFGFFKALQALNVMSSTDHVSDLTTALSSSPSAADEDQEDMADSLILSLDKFNTVMACVHEDAFKAVYDSVREQANDLIMNSRERKQNYYKESANHRRTAADSIDKMFNSASDAIRGQPSVAHSAAASVFIMGTTFIADAIEVCLASLDKMEGSLDDPDCLDAYWTTVQGAVATSVSGMKGVFKLMADDSSSSPAIARSVSNEEHAADNSEHRHMRAASTDGYARSMFRRMSAAFSSPASYAGSYSGSSGGRSSTLPSRKASVSSFVSAPSRKSSVASAVSNPSRTRGFSTTSNASSAGSTGLGHNISGNASRSKSPMPHSGRANHMSPIPATPVTNADSGVNAKVNPFDVTFANNVAFQSNKTCHQNPDDPTMNSSKHARQRSRDIDDDDICPTTPTRESWTLAQAQQQPLHKRRNSSLRQSFSIPFTNTANGIEHDAHRNSALFAPTQDPRTTASSSHDTPVNGIISPASSPANGSSAAHGASTSVGSVADIVGGMPFGLRRRSMNVVSGERPLLDLEGMGMGIGV